MHLPVGLSRAFVPGIFLSAWLLNRALTPLQHRLNFRPGLPNLPQPFPKHDRARIVLYHSHMEY